MEKSGRYFAIFGAIVGGTSAFYLLSPLSDYFKREFSLVESAGMMLLSAGVVAVIFFFAGPPIAAVSYTHLDVYKRQVQGSAPVKGRT